MFRDSPGLQSLSIIVPVQSPSMWKSEYTSECFPMLYVKSVYGDCIATYIQFSVTHVTLNKSDASKSITWPCFKLLNAHFSKINQPMAVLGKWVALNYLNTSFVCIVGLVSALGKCSNGLEWLMHSPSARALSCPWPLLHRPCALIKPCNALTTGI